MIVNKLIPDENHIILKRDNKDELTDGGLIIPEAVGESQSLHAGIVTTMGVDEPFVFKTSYGKDKKIGNGVRVLFEKNHGTYFKLCGNEFIFIHKQYVVAIFDD